MVNLIKHFTIVIYNSRVVLTGKLPYLYSRLVIYDRKMFISLATGCMNTCKVDSIYLEEKD